MGFPDPVLAEDILRLPLLEEGQRVNEMQVCQEAKWFIGFRMNNGSVSPCQTPSQWVKLKGGWDDARRQKIAQNVALIKHWKVVLGSYTECPDIEATWFIDPPYQNRAGSHYPHQPNSFLDLGDWCRSRKGQVMVCENEGADWLPFWHFRDAKAAPGKHKNFAEVNGVSKEVIWKNTEKDPEPIQDEDDIFSLFRQLQSVNLP